MGKLKDYLLSGSYSLTPDQIEEIIDTTLCGAGAVCSKRDRELLRLRVARLVSGVGHVPTEELLCD